MRPPHGNQGLLRTLYTDAVDTATNLTECLKHTNLSLVHGARSAHFKDAAPEPSISVYDLGEVHGAASRVFHVPRSIELGLQLLHKSLFFLNLSLFFLVLLQQRSVSV